MQQKVQVGGLHIGIRKQQIARPLTGKAGRHRGFARSALAAGNYNAHRAYLLGAEAGLTEPSARQRTASPTLRFSMS